MKHTEDCHKLSLPHPVTNHTIYSSHLTFDTNHHHLFLPPGIWYPLTSLFLHKAISIVICCLFLQLFLLCNNVTNAIISIRSSGICKDIRSSASLCRFPLVLGSFFTNKMNPNSSSFAAACVCGCWTQHHCYHTALNSLFSNWDWGVQARNHTPSIPSGQLCSHNKPNSEQILSNKLDWFSTRWEYITFLYGNNWVIGKKNWLLLRQHC